MQIRVEGLNLKHNLDFDKHLALSRQILYHQVKAQEPLSSRMGEPSSALAVQPPASKEKRHLSTGAAGSRTQENQVQLQWMHTKITWAWNCHKTVTSNCQPSAGMPELWEQALTLKSKLGLRNGRGSWSLSLSSWKHQPLDCWVDDEHLYSEREV